MINFLLSIGIIILIFLINIILTKIILKRYSIIGFFGALFFAKGLGGLIIGLIFYFEFYPIDFIYVSSIDPYLLILGIILQLFVIIMQNIFQKKF